MIISISYANGAYKHQQNLNKRSAIKIGKVDKVLSFSSDDIDSQFAEENKNILSQKRGNGCWLWKPYLILRVLLQLKDNDYLIYTDAGILYLKNIKKLIQKLENSGQDIMLFDQPLVELQWTNQSVFEVLECDLESIKYSNQIFGGLLILKKSDNSISFVREWLKLCKNEDLLTGLHENQNQHKHFIAHREDQSLLSVLAKKNGIIPFKSPTDYGKFPSQYLASNRFFYMEKKDPLYDINDTYFLHYRKANPCLYYLKYLSKLIFRKIGLIRV